jgi:rubrerythrin
MAGGEYCPHEVFVIAKEMEEAGIAFYKALARQVGDPDAKALFLKLASDEVQHLRGIEKLEQQTLDRAPNEQDALVEQYIRGLVDTKVFPDPSEADAVARSVGGVPDALAFGIRAERASIAFYSKTWMLGRSEVAGNLIEQEREHLRLLTELWAKHTSDPVPET